MNRRFLLLVCFGYISVKKLDTVKYTVSDDCRVFCCCSKTPLNGNLKKSTTSEAAPKNATLESFMFRHPKTNMTMENQLFEYVFPIQNGDVPLLC